MVIYAAEYYAAMKKDKTMPFAATRMGTELVILSEVSQKREKCYMIPLPCGNKTKKIDRNELNDKIGRNPQT